MKRDSRDSKHKHVIAIYMLNDSINMLFEEEMELRNWLMLLLTHQVRIGANEPTIEDFSFNAKSGEGYRT